MSSPYILLSKKQGQPFSQYRGKAFRLSEQRPHFVDEVKVALKSNKRKINKITTFRDAEGNIIERTFDFFDKDNFKNKQYHKTEYKIGEKEDGFAIATKTQTLPRMIKHVYNEYKGQFKKLGKPSILWQTNSVETHYVSENKHTGGIIHSQTYLKNLETPKSVNCGFIEHPTQTSEGKSLKFKINFQNDKISNVETYNAQLPKHDKFLKFRAMDIEFAKEHLCKFFIKENKLTKLNLKPNTNYNGDKKIIALYDDENGSININKNYEFKSKTKLVETVRHEIEHAWQWFLHARNTGGQNPRAMELAKKFGGIKDGKLKALADKCTKSINSYVPFSKDIVAYRKNWVEKAAKSIGFKTAIQYDKQGQCLRKQFPHIPREMF